MTQAQAVIETIDKLGENLYEAPYTKAIRLVEPYYIGIYTSWGLDS